MMRSRSRTQCHGQVTGQVRGNVWARPPGRESHQGLGAAEARHGPAPTSGRPAPPSPRARAGPAPQPIPARRRGVAAPACGLRRVGGSGAGNMEELLKRELGCDSVKATGHSGGGCISQGQSYDTDKGRVFVKVNSKPEVRVAAVAGWGAGPGRGCVFPGPRPGWRVGASLELGSVSEPGPLAEEALGCPCRRRAGLDFFGLRGSDLRPLEPSGGRCGSRPVRREPLPLLGRCGWFSCATQVTAALKVH